MTALTLHFWTARDNVEDIVLTANRTALSNIGGITRVRLEIIEPAAAFDSATESALFEFPVTVSTGTYAGSEAIRLKLGASGLAPGRYAARLVTFDADNPEGLAWEPLLNIIMA